MSEQLSIFPKARIEQLEQLLEKEKKDSAKHLKWAENYKNQFVEMMDNYHTSQRELYLVKQELKKHELYMNVDDKIMKIQQENKELNEKRLKLERELIEERQRTKFFNGNLVNVKNTVEKILKNL